jgi:hypothetical protein
MDNKRTERLQKLFENDTDLLRGLIWIMLDLDMIDLEELGQGVSVIRFRQYCEQEEAHERETEKGIAR